MKRIIPVICATCTFLAVPLLSSTNEEGDWELFSKIEQLNPFQQISPISTGYSATPSAWPFTIQGGSSLTHAVDYTVTQDTDSLYHLDITTTNPITIGTNSTGTSVEATISNNMTTGDTYFDNVSFRTDKNIPVVNFSTYDSSQILRGQLIATSTNTANNCIEASGNLIITGSHTNLIVTSGGFGILAKNNLSITDGATVIATTNGNTVAVERWGSDDILVENATLLTFAPNNSSSQSMYSAITVNGKDSFVCIQGEVATTNRDLTTDGQGTIYSSPNLSYVNGQVVVSTGVLTKHEPESKDNTKVTVTQGSLIVSKDSLVAGSTGATVDHVLDGVTVTETLGKGEYLTGSPSGGTTPDVTTPEDTTISFKDNLSLISLSSLTYNGKIQYPVLTYDGATLTEGVDYEKTTSTDSIRAGTYNISITGIGNYKDTITTPYTIAQATLTVTPDTGQSHVLGETMGKISYKVDDIIEKEPMTFTGALGLDRDADDIGWYTIVNNNLVLDTKSTDFYASDYELNVVQNVLYEVTNPNVNAVDLSSASVAKISSTTYSGNPYTPHPTVTLDGKTLVKDTDYVLSYQNNVDYGTGTVTITGKGNYKGNLTESFFINKATLLVTPTSGLQHSYGDSDKAITYTVSEQMTGETPEFSGSLGRSAGRDAGSYPIVIGSLQQIDTATCNALNYNISLQSENYEILPKNIDTVTVSEIASVVYNGTQQIPSYTISNQGQPMTAGSDFSLSAVNHRNVGIATMTFSGIGNYTGTKDVLFQITPKEILVTPKSGQSHYLGATQSTLDYTFTGNITGETPKFTGSLSRSSGNTVGTYSISQGSLELTDNGLFDKDNYTLQVTSGVTYEILATPTVPDTSTPDTSTPDTSTPDTSTPDTSTPDTSTPDTSTPDTSTPDTSTPDTSTPDTSTPDTSTPDTSTPDTSTPDTSTPDTSTPDTSTPDTSTPDTSTPDTSTPDTSTPDTSTPDTSTPDTSTPDTSTPDTSTPDTSTSDTSTPDTSTPDTSTPDTNTPDTNPPESGADSNQNNELGTESNGSTDPSGNSDSSGSTSSDSDSSGSSSSGSSSSGSSNSGSSSSGSSSSGSSSSGGTGSSNSNTNTDSSAPSVSTNTSNATNQNGTTSTSGTGNTTGTNTETDSSTSQGTDTEEGLYPEGTTFDPVTGEPILPPTTEGTGSDTTDFTSPQGENLGSATDLSQSTFLEESEESGFTVVEVIAGAVIATVSMIGVGVAVTAGNVGVATAVAGSSNVVGTSMLDKAYDLFRRARSIFTGESEESTLRRFKLRRKKPFSEKLLLKNAKKKHYALPQVSVSDYATVEEILWTVKEDKSPLILDITPLLGEHEEDEDYHAVMDHLHKMVKVQKVKVPLGYHIQVDTYEDCLESFDLGLSSILYSISDLDEEELGNLAELCKIGKKKQINMEFRWNLIDEEGDVNPISPEVCEQLEAVGVSALVLDVYDPDMDYPEDWDETLEEAIDLIQEDSKKLHIVLADVEYLDEDYFDEFVHDSVNKIHISEGDEALEDMSLFSEKLESLQATGKGNHMLKTLNTSFRFCSRFLNYF